MSIETKTELEKTKEKIAELQARRELAMLKRQVERMEQQESNPATGTEHMETISDFLGMIMREKTELRDGLIDTEKARINVRLNGQILQAAELNIKHARLNRGKEPKSELRLIGTSAAAKSE